MDIQNQVAVITGAAGGIGRALAGELARRGARKIALVDRTECVATASQELNDEVSRVVALPFPGDVTDPAFRQHVFDSMTADNGPVTICVPAAGITRDDLTVRLDKTTGEVRIYPEETFRVVVDVNLIAPVYWVLEMVARIAQDRYRRGVGRWHPAEHVQGVGILIGSVSSQGNKGQISYATTKAGLEGAAATLMKEAIFYGVRCALIHPGYTDTPMVQALGEEFIARNILPYTQLGRLIRPQEIADAICFMISNSAVSGELWADAGWHPPA
jgi:3-oxoacyl-[acyl-carrier protein] reductase